MSLDPVLLPAENPSPAVHLDALDEHSGTHTPSSVVGDDDGKSNSSSTSNPLLYTPALERNFADSKSFELALEQPPASPTPSAYSASMSELATSSSKTPTPLEQLVEGEGEEHIVNGSYEVEHHLLHKEAYHSNRCYIL